MKNPWRNLRYALIGWIGSTFIRIWCSTLRIEYRFPVDGPRHQILAGQSAIMSGFHESLLPCIYLLGPLKPCALISQSDDGELIARIMKGLGWSAIRGSSTRGGREALLKVLSVGRSIHPFRMAFTVDGPRGPRRQSKMGAVYAASGLGVPLMPISVYAEKAWRAKSWDRLILPKPFSRVAIVADHLIHVPEVLDEATAEQFRLQLEAEINRAEDIARMMIEGTAKRPATQMEEAA